MPLGMCVRRTALSVLLTCCPPAPEAHVGLVDLDVDRVVDHREDADRGEGGLAAGVGVEGRDAHQPVDAALGLQPAIGVGTADAQRGRLDARLLARALLLDLDLEPMVLGPAHVEALEHLRPVLALGAARAGLDLEIGVVGVGLAREQRLHGALLGDAAQVAQRLLGGRELVLVVLLGGELDQADRVVVVLLQRAVERELAVERRALAQHHLGRLRIVPERRVVGAGVQFVEAAERGIVVKDTSSAVPATA